MKHAKLLSWILAVGGMLVPATRAFGDEVGASPVDTEPLLHLWKVHFEPDPATAQAGKFPFKDQLLFEASNLFTAEAFGALGFGQVPYTVTAVDGATLAFSSSASNGEQGTLSWNGVLREGQIVGTLVWTRDGTVVGTYHFTGTVSADD